MATSEKRPHRASHRRPRRLRWVLLAIATVVVLALGGGAASQFGEQQDQASDCLDEPIRVAAAPEIAPTVARVLEAAEDECVSFEVTERGPASTAEAIGLGDAPDVWIPTSSTWLDAVEQPQSQDPSTDGSSDEGSSEDSSATDDGTEEWTAGPSIAKSPVVLAAGSTMADRPNAVSSWADYVDGDRPLRMANPESDTASRLAFHGSRVASKADMGLQLGGRLIFMSRFAAPSMNQLLDDYRADPVDSQPFPASEQQVFAFNTEHPAEPELDALMPRDGTLVFDYPWITRPDLDRAQFAAAERGRVLFGQAETRATLSEAGFRTADGQGGPELNGKRPATLTELTPLDRDERLEAVARWEILRTDMRMLALVDVSGSVLWPSPTPGLSRFDVITGALAQGVRILPAGSQVGGWIFSTDQDGEIPYRELAPVRRLDAAEGSGTHRDELADLIEQASTFIAGDTALNDSVWAAYQHMQEEYDPDYVNSVVLFTDGVNDNPRGGLSLEELLEKIEAAKDPERPVVVVTVGSGEADADALRQIAEATDGTSYIAETPDDITRVFIEALLARPAK